MTPPSDSEETASGRERNGSAGGGSDSAGRRPAGTAAQESPSTPPRSSDRPDDAGDGAAVYDVPADGGPAAVHDAPAGLPAEPNVSEIGETDPGRVRTEERLRKLGVRRLTPEERAARSELLQAGRTEPRGVDPGTDKVDGKVDYVAETGNEPSVPLPPPPGAADDAGRVPPREHLVSQAASFLSSPPVREASIERQNAFLQKKGLTAEETALARQKALALSKWPGSKSFSDRPGMTASPALPPPLPPRPPASAYPVSVTQPFEPPRPVAPRLSPPLSLIALIIFAASACGGLAGLLQRLLNNALGRILLMQRLLYSSQYLRWSTFVGNVRALQALLLPLPDSVIDEQKRAAALRAEATEDVSRALAADGTRRRTEQEKEGNAAASVDPGRQTRQVSASHVTPRLDHPPELAVSRLVSRTLPKCALAVHEFARRAEEVTATRKRIVRAIRSTKAAGGGLRRLLAAVDPPYRPPLFYPGAGAGSGGEEGENGGRHANADQAHGEAVAALKDDIRAVKGVLLNARNFPSPFAPPG